MIITVTPELEATIKEAASKQEMTPEEFALQALQAMFPPHHPPMIPRDDWERGLLSAGRDCGVSLSNEALSSEGIYD